MLPLGLRVQEKLERLIDKHMRSARASKVSLSSISSQALWERSGRLKQGGELFTFKDRKKTAWLLAPTHEEEITSLLAHVVQTREQLPIRLYQVGRKYRDEKRPRGGLLRGREFLMKDLYTFDSSPEEAHITYDEIRTAYRSFLDELKVKYIEARATSGDMGGNLSHEYHFPNMAGEDIVITCSSCDYARNEEFVTQQPYSPQAVTNYQELVNDSLQESHAQFLQRDFVSTDGQNLVRAIAAVPSNLPLASEASTPSINPYAVKAALSGTLEIDTGVEEPLMHFMKLQESTTGDRPTWKRSIHYLLDSSVPPASIPHSSISELRDENANFHVIQATKDDGKGGINLLKHEAGDPCPQCKAGKLRLDKAIEVGHTFHLGTRYSSKLGLATQQEGGKSPIPVEMGCHGIGVSRLIAATASCLADEVGLNWPRVIAPFEAVIIVQPSQTRRLQAAEGLYDQLSQASASTIDVILDDRLDHGLGWKLKDADMIGYPVIIVVGKGFDQGKVEVQCRRLKVKQEVELGQAVGFVKDVLKQL